MSEAECAREELFEWWGHFFGFLDAEHIARHVQVHKICGTAPQQCTKYLSNNMVQWWYIRTTAYQKYGPCWDLGLLGCDAVLPGKWFLVCWRHYAPVKCQEPLTQWHNITSEKTCILSNTAIKAKKPAWPMFSQTINKYSRTPVIWITNYPDQLGPSSKFVENSAKLTCLEITRYRIKYSTVLWLIELQIRRGRKV